jgi:hypothetical protein
MYILIKRIMPISLLHLQRVRPNKILRTGMRDIMTQLSGSDKYGINLPGFVRT